MPGPTPKTGTIPDSETWDLAGSPYHITDSITLAEDVFISVEAGVEIEVQKRGATITMGTNGRFIFGGTKDAPIWIHGLVNIMNFWGGFRDAPGAVITAFYTTFENAEWLVSFSQSTSPYAGLWWEDCIVRMNAHVFHDNGNEIYIFLRDNRFENNQNVFNGGLQPKLFQSPEHEEGRQIEGNIFFDNGWVIVQANADADFIAVNNKFYRQKRGVVWVKTGQAGAIKIEDNWFGSDSGPTDSGNPDGTGELIQNDGTTVIDYEPWQTLGRYVPVPDDVREYVNRILREGSLSGEETATSVLDDESLDRMIDRAEKRVDRWMAPGPALEKRFLGYGSETQEMHDVRPGDRHIQLRYRPIVAVTLVEIRGGSGSSWSTVTEQESGGWYASEEDKRRGQIHIDSEPTFTKDSFRVTYTHGYYDAPEEVRAAVIRLVALDVFSAILQPGQEDPYTARARALREDIKEMKEELLERKRRHVVF